VQLGAPCTIVWSRVKADFAAACRGNIEIGFAYQQRTELGLVECAKELCKPAMRYVEFQRLLIMAAHVDRNIALGNFSHGGVHRAPFAARAAFNGVAYGCEQLFRPVAQGLLNESAPRRGTRNWAWMRVLSSSDSLGSTK
jgi:hypothetical protein